MTERIWGNQELETLDILRGRTGAVSIHIATSDPLRSWRHSNLVTHPVVSDHLAGGECAVIIGIDGNRRVLAGSVVPVVIVIHRRAIPATVMRFQGRMIPLYASIVASYHQTLATIP